MVTTASDSVALTIPPEAELAAAVPPSELELLSEQALDQLPYGVIALDLEGRVVRYNLAESRFARLDRAQVLGRRFFLEVAPCTATPEFKGRFEALTATGAAGDTVQFSYLFDFKFGAQQVDIELVRGRAQPWVLVLVNRRRFLPQRTGLPEGFAAPLQSELAQGEPEAGVLRGEQQARLLHLPASMFSALRATGDRVSPRAWSLITGDWGFQWGRLAVVDLETEASEQRDKPLRELPMREVMARVSDHLARQGLGRLTADFSYAREGVFVLDMARSALAEAAGISDTPRCDLLAGHLRALFCHLAGKRLVVRELGCAAQGYPSCTFVAAAQERLPVLDAAIAMADGQLPALLEALRSAEGFHARG